MSAATANPPGLVACSLENAAHTRSSSGLSAWQETTAYRSRDVTAIPAEVSPRFLTRGRIAVAVIALAAALPRLAVVVHERGTILTDFVDKSDRFATTLVDSGTFGFLPGRPSAYTQPLYGWFLAALYWPFGHSWLAVGLAQTAVGVATALVVLEIGRELHSLSTGVVAALITTLHPYVIWHDVHANREVLDGLVLAVLVLLAVLAWDDRSLQAAAATGVVAGVAILGNARLVALPLAIGVYLAWRLRPPGRGILTFLAVVVAAAAVVAPWVIRNRVQVGCFAITTDTRALWKANNLNTYDVLARGGWIDDVPNLPGGPPWPELAADLTLAHPKRPVTVDECAQMRLYRHEVVDFWRDHPGEKARLSAQAVRMLWTPKSSVASDNEGTEGLARDVRTKVEPAFMVVLYALAIAGIFFAPRFFVALALPLLAYNTAAAMAFAGAVRYRAPWDFLLALLAAFTLERLWRAVRHRGYEEPSAAR
jgi:4-amino-4-deoxy-L-arabinose transferase-like glycosyltransferase